MRKVRLKVFFGEMAGPSDVSLLRSLLPRRALPSSFEPKLSSGFITQLEDFATSLKAKAKKIIAQHYHRYKLPFPVRRALAWLRHHHSTGSICKINGDKNYGPVICSQQFVQHHLQRIPTSGSYQAVTFRSYIDKVWDLSQFLEHLLMSACWRGYIDDKTRLYLLQPFKELLSLPHELCLQRLRRLPGQIRYLLKLHKNGLAVRKIEIDRRSPMGPLASWMSEVLNQISRTCRSVILDSKHILTHLEFNKLTPSSSSHFISADLVSYFDRIKIASLKQSLEIRVRQFFGNRRDVAVFVCKVLDLLLAFKYVVVGGVLYQKTDSLSTGEKVATDCANIHRDVQFEPVLDQFNSYIDVFWGYVDDCAVHFLGPTPLLHDFLQALSSVDPVQFEWEFKISATKLVMLDLEIVKADDFHASGGVHTCTYRKPSFRAQYLPPSSSHRLSTKTAIVKGEVNRFLLNDSSSAAFDKDVARFKKDLKQRGYTFADSLNFSYNPDKRANLLKKLHARTLGFRKKKYQDNQLSFCTGYSPSFDAIEFSKEWTKFVSTVVSEAPSLASCRLQVAFRNYPSSFLRTYRLHWPR